MMAIDEGLLHFNLSLIFMAMCEVTGIREGKKSDLSLVSMSVIRDSIFEDIQIGDIVRRNRIAYGTATKCVAKLEKNGYVRRTRGDGDGRAVYVVPTQKGQKWFDEMEIRMDAYVKDGLSKLAPEEQKTMVDLLSRFTGYSEASLREESLIRASGTGITLKGGAMNGRRKSDD